MAPHSTRLAAACAAATVTAACGGGAAGSTAAPQRPQVSVVQGGTPAAPGAGSVGPVATPTGAGRAGARPGGASGTAPAAVGGSSGPAAAAPGRYPIAVSTQRQGGPPSSSPPAQSSGQGTLAVAAPSAVAGGMAQSSTISEQGSSFTLSEDVLFPAGGGMELTRSRSTATALCPPFSLDPDQPLEVVPAQLTPGATWGPTQFHSSTISGTVTGFVDSQNTDTVAGSSVSAWSTRLTIDISSGTYCGYRFTGRIQQAGEWAPSLHLFTSGSITSALQFAAFGQVTSITTYRLLSTRPG